MPLVHDFEYHKPATLAAAIKLLGKYKKPAILAGGTDIVGEIKEGMATPDALIDIKGLTDLRKIEFKNGKLTIGSLITFTQLIESKVIQSKFPVIAEVARMVASVGIRNRATMVGNICSAVPCMDSGPVLSAYDAILNVKGARGVRKIPIDKWFLGPRKTGIKKGEIATGITIALPDKKHSGCYVKLGRYSGEDLAQASVLILALPKDTYRIAFGSVGPTPIRAYNIEKLVNGQKLDDALIAKAKELILKTVFPITDIRATKEYRMHMCQVMFERGIKAASSRLAGNGPAYGHNQI
jgi:CO/xanthine dehydrogenase FAD-binding subunit